ncbi:hypothetical protein TNIN_115731 [Trichonephila inaurata madagascariensis]|uniref:Uncharacterized protein n=1 Tax=Trichonephila inaurata madagascariensis TaxID=2747483 RepID=A0A8X7C7X3_9ARAC|nr:hypothetical protein TNIN_115731 [Trichonephila inaurata madagascariensis]
MSTVRHSEFYRRSIKNKRLMLLTEGVVLLHDKALLHVSRFLPEELVHFKRGKQPDHPPYSLGMSPCDFHGVWFLVKTLKRETRQRKKLKGKKNQRALGKGLYPRHGHTNFLEKGKPSGKFKRMFCQALVYTLNKVFIYTHSVVS